MTSELERWKKDFFEVFTSIAGWKCSITKKNWKGKPIVFIDEDYTEEDHILLLQRDNKWHVTFSTLGTSIKGQATGKDLSDVVWAAFRRHSSKWLHRGRE